MLAIGAEIAAHIRSWLCERISDLIRVSYLRFADEISDAPCRPAYFHSSTRMCWSEVGSHAPDTTVVCDHSCSGR
jgi:hypothetical protein